MVKSPVRVALVGLTASPTSFAWLTNFHYPYLASSPQYEIIALLNSSIPAAEAAIKKFNLPPSTKAYSSPQALADDPDVDLVYVGVKAPLHKEVLLPSLLNGKSAFVEWPLGATLEEGEELERAAADGTRNFIGLQGRHSPVVVKIKEVVQSGVIGKVLSTSALGTVTTGGGKPEPQEVKYSLSAGSGATMVDIHFAHFMEVFCHALGEVKTVTSLVATQRRTVDILDRTGAVVEKEAPKTAPDQVIMLATLESGAVASLHMRGGSIPCGHFRWLIHGEKGEIEVTGAAMLVHINIPGLPYKMCVSDADGKVLQQAEIKEDEPGQPAVTRLWKAYSQGQTDGYGDFKHAVRRHRLIQAIYDSSTEGRMFSL